MTDKIAREPNFTGKVLIVVLATVLLLVLWQTSVVFLLAFGAIILAVGLRSMADPLARELRLNSHVALAITTLAVLVFGIGFFVAFGARAAIQLTLLAEELPGAIVVAKAWLQTTQLGRHVLELTDVMQREAAGTLLRALPLAGGLLGAIGNFALIIVVGIYLAADPETYLNGALRLLPPTKRKRAREVATATGEALRKWLVGMALDMVFLGLVTGLGLWAVGVPLPFALGVLSGLSVFVPYIGPIIATIPGLLIALSHGPMLALYAAIVYVIAQQLEGNISLPLLQRWTVSLPPVIGLLAIIAFGLLFGVWGVLLATPLAVAVMTIVRLAYVEDVLERKP